MRKNLVVNSETNSALISHSFYDGEIELKYDPVKHIYYLVNNGVLTPVSSVTTIVKIIDKSNILIPWAVKITIEKLLSSVVFPIEEKEFITLALASKNAHKERLEDAGAVGTQAHNLIENYILEQIKHPSKDICSYVPNIEDERVAKCFNAAFNWMVAHNVRWICTERKIYSKKYNYAGTLDGIAIVDSCDNKKCCPNEFKDRRSVIDWKTSNGIYREYFLQTAAYKYAYMEETGEWVADRWIIRLGKEDGVFEPWHLEDLNDEAEDFESFLSCLNLTKYCKDLESKLKETKRRRK